MAKIKLNNLPEGFEIKNGKVVKKMQQGGLTMGDQRNYGLVTNPFLDGGGEAEPSDVRYSLSSVPREVANLEAEGGETVLTDLNNDGQFGLYDIKGPRHSSGGVPMYLPEQSFVFSDTNDMKFDKNTLSEFGINSKKKMTPAKVSKKFGLNKYFGVINEPTTDKIGLKSAELMIAKNGGQLSKLAFAQESKKQFSDGVPVTAHPYLISQGIDPIEFTQKIEDITKQQAMQKAMNGMPPEQLEQMLMMQQIMQQAGQMPEEEMMQPPMAKYGTELEKYTDGREKKNIAFDKDIAKTYNDLFDIKINTEGIEENMYETMQKDLGNYKWYGDADKNYPGFLSTWEGIYPDLETLKTSIAENRVIRSGPKKGENEDVRKFQIWLNETYIPQTVEKMKQETIAAGKNWNDAQTTSYTKSRQRDFGFDPDGERAKRYDGKLGTVTSSRRPINFTLKPGEEIQTTKKIIEPIEPNTYIPPGEEPEIPMYLQDRIDMANTAMLKPRIGRGLTNQISGNAGLANYSPEYLMQKQLSAAKQFSDSILSSSNSQAGLANIANMAGNVLENLAGTASLVQGKNIDGLNRFLENDSQRNLKIDMYNAAAKEREYDKNELAMENYNNWMNKRNTLFSKQLTNAITNRSNARNISSIFPNMSIGTGWGGDIYMTNPRALQANKSATPEQLRAQKAKALQDAMEYAPNAKDPIKVAEWLYGNSSAATPNYNTANPAQMDPAQVQAMMLAMGAKKGKEVKKYKYASPFYSGKMGGF